MPPSLRPAVTHPGVSRILNRLALLLVLGVLIVEPQGLRGHLEAIAPARRVAPRLSTTTEHRSCPSSLPPGGTIPQSRCPSEWEYAGTARRLATFPAEAKKRFQERGSLEALHVTAIMEIAWPDTAGNSLGRAISSLQEGARAARRPAPLLADLAGAHLVRAELAQDPRDLAAAIEAAAEAVALEPRNRAARFNLALALDRMGADSGAARAWREYLAVDPASGWADEARGRLRELAAAPAPPVAPPAGAPADAVARYVAAAPQEARLRGWEDLLGGWGAEILRGETAAAVVALRGAEALGAALERQGGDASLADAVRAIRAHAHDPAATRALAKAHAAYRNAWKDIKAGKRESPALAAAHQLAQVAPSQPLGSWAMTVEGARLIYIENDLPRAEQVYRALLAGTDTLRHPALAASAHGGLGTTWFRSGKYLQARDAYRRAARVWARAGEPERVGAMRSQEAHTEFKLGNSPDAYALLHLALATLRPYRGSEWLANTLSAGAEEVALDGYVRAAVLLQTEGFAVAEALSPLVYRVEALLWRSQMRIAAGEPGLAEADVRSGEEILPELDEKSRAWVRVDLALARAAVLMERSPAAARAVLDSVLAARVGGLGSADRVLRARVRRADAALRMGDARTAAVDLDVALRVLDEQGGSIGSAVVRASLLDEARAVFDRMVMLQVSEGRPRSALAYLERGRTSFSPSARRDTLPATRWQMPTGSTAVVYALVADTLLAWTVADSTVRMVRETVDRAELLRTIGRLRLALEGRLPEPRGDLAALYDGLVDPVAGHLEEGTRLVLVVDGELAAVPFAALRDAARNRYLVEDHVLRFASSLRDAQLSPQPAVPSRGPALFVADPAFDEDEHDEERLPEAREEVRLAAAWYPQSLVLGDAGATRAAVDATLRRASIFHFAGHAVFDDIRPERSFLLFARDGGAAGEERLTPAEVGEMELGWLRLVVLSACETLRSRDGRSAGFAGFAGALLAAGAQGVVGSLWRVEERSTRELMVEFHRDYHRSGDAAGALRDAQLTMLRAGRPPAAWAGFRYAGN